MMGWIVGLLLGLAITTAGTICVVEFLVLGSDDPRREQRVD